MKHSPHLSAVDAQHLHDQIGVYPNHPKPGVTFRDLLPACANGPLFEAVILAMSKAHGEEQRVTHVVGVESRGLIFGPMLAAMLGVGFVAVRKAAVRPWETVTESYNLEYGTATLELAVGLLNKKSRVVIVDDLLAIGGTAGAATALCRKVGATVVSVDVVLELDGLGGRKRLAPLPVNALMTL